MGYRSALGKIRRLEDAVVEKCGSASQRLSTGAASQLASVVKELRSLEGSRFKTVSQRAHLLRGRVIEQGYSPVEAWQSGFDRVTGNAIVKVSLKCGARLCQSGRTRVGFFLDSSSLRFEPSSRGITPFGDCLKMDQFGFQTLSVPLPRIDRVSVGGFLFNTHFVLGWTDRDEKSFASGDEWTCDVQLLSSSIGFWAIVDRLMFRIDYWHRDGKTGSRELARI